MSFESPALTWAQRYLEQGFSVIPVDSKSKKATVKWADYQKRMPTEDELKEWFGSGKSGMAIVTGGISQLCVIDVDSHKHPDAIEKIKPYLPPDDTYPIARSQSGGWHLYFRCNGDLRGGVNMPFEGADLRAEGNYIICPPSDGYTWKRKIEDDGSNLYKLSSSYLNILSSTSSRTARSMPDYSGQDTPGQSGTSWDISFKEGNRDESLFHVANSLIRGGMSGENAFKVLNIIAKNCNPPFPEKEVPEKVRSAIDRVERKKRNLTQEIREWIETSSGTFAGHELDIELQSGTKRDKETRRKALLRLLDEGLIERVGERQGYYRRVENQVEEIDWRSASTEALDILWPFQIEKMVKLHPGSLVVIAGEVEAGKTSVMLNLVKMNMNRDYEIYYASSEFGGEELKERLSGFEDMTLDDWNFHFFNRADEFQDVIKPDAINIIDYLEISDNFYQVGGKLKAIHDKLGKGIAVVALQKDPKAAQGRGGSFSLEKPRLYLNIMDNYPAGQLVQIRKAKNWVDKSRNPNRMERGFKIYAGCILTATGDWYRPERQKK